MRRIFTGDYNTADGVNHPEAVATLYRLEALVPANQLASRANVEINYYHNAAALLSGKEVIDTKPYLFTVGGDHPFEQVFIAGQDSQANLATYFADLPEFEDWITSII